MSRDFRLLMLIAALGVMLLLIKGPNTAHSQGASPNTSQGGSAAYRLDWAAVGEISGGASASANYRLSATIGQMGAGTQSNSAGYGLCVGFQCGFTLDGYRVYLPVVIR